MTETLGPEHSVEPKIKLVYLDHEFNWITIIYLKLQFRLSYVQNNH